MRSEESTVPTFDADAGSVLVCSGAVVLRLAAARDSTFARPHTIIKDQGPASQ